MPKSTQEQPAWTTWFIDGGALDAKTGTGGAEGSRDRSVRKSYFDARGPLHFQTFGKCKQFRYIGEDPEFTPPFCPHQSHVEEAQSCLKLQSLFNRPVANSMSCHIVQCLQHLFTEVFPLLTHDRWKRNVWRVGATELVPQYEVFV